MPSIRPCSSFAVLLALAGACGYPTPSPARPTITLPEIRTGDQLVLVEGEGTITSETNKSLCSDPSCWVKEKHEVNARFVSVKLRDEVVTKGQVQVMLEPDWKAKERAYDAANARCKGARIWRKLAIGAVAAGGISAALLSDRIHGTDYLYLAGGTLALSGALWTIGRLAGGSACVEAKNLYTQYYFFRDQAEFAGRDEDEIKTLVARFNAKNAAPAEGASQSARASAE